MKKKARTDNTSAEYQPPRKANECIANEKNIFRPSPLFDEFWREGELALFFGAPGAGKSLLAMQLADAITRGHGLDGFRMPAGRRKVLYIDLVLTDAQFQARYSHFPPGSNYAKSYKFTENLYRGRPPSNDELVDWLRSIVLENGFQIVIIDDISAIKRTHDGTRETLSLMRRLKELRDELDVSVMVLADSEEPGRSGVAEEHDLRRSRVLCSVADSVFAIGRSVRRTDELCLIQTRSQNAPIFWTTQNAPTARVKRLDAGLLGLEFDERFAPYIDPEKLKLICRVHTMHDAGGSYRVIAQRLNISRSQAARLYKKWTPEMEMENEELRIENGELRARNEMSEPSTAGDASGTDGDFSYDDMEDQDEADDEYLREIGMAPSSFLEDDGREMDVTQIPFAAGEGCEMDVTQIPFAAGLARRSVYDLEVALNAYGREIYVEEWNGDSRPYIWYEFNRQSILVKSVRGPAGIQVSNLGKTQFL